MSWKLLILASLVSGFVYLRYEGYCISERRFLPDSELFAIAMKDASRSIFNEEKDLDEVIDFIRENPSCCNVIRSKNEYVESEDYRKAAKNFEGYFFPSILGRLLGSENFLIEIRYYGIRQNSKTFDEPGPRIVYRVTGACGKVKSYL